jgi:hypothetical protein
MTVIAFLFVVVVAIVALVMVWRLLAKSGLDPFYTQAVMTLIVLAVIAGLFFYAPWPGRPWP